MAMLEVKDLNVYYGMIQAIKGISFEVNQGEVIALIGANGAGKTTTLHAVTGLTPVKSGHIFFEGKDITKVPAHKIVSMGMAHVPEGRRVFAQLSVYQNLKMGAYTRKDKDEIRQTLDMVYEHFPRLEERKNQMAGTLSGGEQQMLAMGRALMSHPKIILMDEWESKIKAIVENTWNKDVISLSGVPSWMLVLIKAVLKKTGREYLTDVWPNLEVFFHGGISFEPYREQYKTLIPSDKMHYMETYNASEGFFGLQDDPTDPSLLMMPDYGIFYEFIPMNEVGNAHPTVLPLESVETGKNYAMVITTSGGLWRYQIGDTVRFTSLFPHKFVISGRTKHFINAFGEELMVDNADKAIAMTCLRTGAKVKEYTAAPLFMLDKAKGRHQWFIEFDKKPESLDEFATLLDQNLQKLNSDYEAKRYKEISLQPLEIVIAHDGAFYEWLKQKGKLGGQHKIPRLSNDRTHIEELLRINQSL